MKDHRAEMTNREMACLVLFMCDRHAANYVTGLAFAANGGGLA